MPEADVATLGPRTRFDPKLEGRLANVGAIARSTVAIYAATVTIDRIFPLPGGPYLRVPLTMRPIPESTALGMVVITLAAVLAVDTRRTDSTSKTGRMTGRALAIAAVIVGAGLTALAVAASFGAQVSRSAQLPSLGASLSILILGAAILLSIDRRETTVIGGQVAALLVFSVMAVILAEYSLGDPALGSFMAGPEISLHAAVIAFLSSIGVFLIRPGSGVLSVASSPGPGGKVLRRFGPLVLLAPAVLIWLAEAVSPVDRIDALALIAVTLGMFLLVFLTALVRTVDRAAVETSTAVAVAERAQMGLRQAVPVMADLAQDLHVIGYQVSEHWDIATRYRPAAGVVAGDATIVTTIPGGELCVVMVDLTGHGSGPALDAIKLRDRLAHAVALGHTPAQSLSSVMWAPPADRLATAVVARIGDRTGEAILASAGHPPVVFITPQRTELLEPTGPLLFGGGEPGYENRSVILSPGDALVFFSDGIADVQRMRSGRTEPQVLADTLLSEGGEAARGAEMTMAFADPEVKDDQTVVVIRRVK